MANRTWLEQQWRLVTDQAQADKIYLEAHRDGHQLDERIIPGVKAFFAERGVEISGASHSRLRRRTRPLRVVLLERPRAPRGRA
jgi:hypothetical protein